VAVCVPSVGVMCGDVYLGHQGWGLVSVVVVRVGTFCVLVYEPGWMLFLVPDA
jgi:hypothetical protein